MAFESIQLETARLLRDNLDLRHLNARERVWLLVRQKHSTAKFSTVERSIRKIQNEMKLYLPNTKDNRYFLEEVYKDEFKFRN